MTCVPETAVRVSGLAVVLVILWLMGPNRALVCRQDLTRNVSLGAIALEFVFAGCNESAPGLPLPGTLGGGPARLFYPIAIGVDPCGTTLDIANSNFDRGFNNGTLVSIPTSMFEPNRTPPTATATGFWRSVRSRAGLAQRSARQSRAQHSHHAATNERLVVDSGDRIKCR